jgi:hypothetical protein
MTTRNEVKKIPTMTWLLRRAETLYRKDPAEYKKLRNDGSDKFLKGCLTKMALQDTNYCTTFQLMSPGKSDAYAQITGAKVGEEFYTHYHLYFTTTQYRKRMHKYLPVSMPVWVKAGLNTTATYHNADGSVARVGRWHGGKPRRKGGPDCAGLVIRDRDGKFMDSVQDFSGVQNILQNSHASQPIDLMHGFLPGTCLSKIDWYASMVPPEWDNHDVWPVMKGSDVGGTAYKIAEPVWDKDRMRALATRVHADAIKMTKQFPYLKVALYPGKTFTGAHEVERIRFGGSVRMDVVVGRNDQADPLFYRLPELVLHWIEPSKNTAHKMHPEPRWIRVVIPPAGSRQLMSDGYSAFSADYLWGKSMDSNRYRREVFDRKRPLARAFRQLPCYRLGMLPNNSLRSATRMKMLGGHAYAKGEVESEKDLHDWSDSQSVVMVWELSDHSQTFGYDEARVMKPEGIFNSIEERELVNSLPLC